MNCKPGQIARFSLGTAFPENINRLVQVNRSVGGDASPATWLVTALQTVVVVIRPAGYVTGVPAGTVLLAFDSHLRPLHDGDGEDEMLEADGTYRPQEVFA